MQKSDKIRFLLLSLGPIITILIIVFLISFMNAFDFSKLFFFYILNVIYTVVHLIGIWCFIKILKKNTYMTKRTMFYTQIIISVMLILGFLGFIIILIFDPTDYRFIIGLSVVELYIFGFGYYGIISIFHEKEN